MAQPPAEEPWPQIPGYEILRQLGAGGMGSVYAARKAGDPRLCAIKVLNQNMLGRDFAVRRFWKEVEVLMLQSHPGIVELRDAGQARDGRLYLTTELIVGTDLFRLIHRAGPMPLPVWLEVADQFLKALEAAHRLTGPSGQTLKLIHRDLKPENLMVTFDGRVVVLDFGLAHARADSDSSARITRVGQVMGTPKYMSPEQICEPDQVDHRTDIYSGAIVLYVSAVGRTQGRDLPNGDDQQPVAALWAQMVEPQWRALSSLAPQIPSSVDPAMALGLALEPDQRPATAEAFRRVLMEGAGTEPSGPERLGAFVTAQFRSERMAFEAWLAQFEGTSAEVDPTGYQPLPARGTPAAALAGSGEATVAAFAPTQISAGVPPTAPVQAAVRPQDPTVARPVAGVGSPSLAPNGPRSWGSGVRAPEITTPPMEQAAPRGPSARAWRPPGWLGGLVLGAGLMWAFGSGLGPRTGADVDPVPNEKPKVPGNDGGAPAALPAVRPRVPEAPVEPSPDAVPGSPGRLAASRNRSRRPSPRKTAPVGSSASRQPSGLADSTENNATGGTPPAAGTPAEKNRASGLSSLDEEWTGFVREVMEIQRTEGESAAWVELTKRAEHFGVQSCVESRHFANAPLAQALRKCGPRKR